VSTLIELLDDPSPTVWGEVRRELERHGRGAVAALERAARQSSPHARGRARLVLLSLDRQRVMRRLAGFALRADIDLERGLWLISRLENPGLDVRPYLLALDAMAAEVTRRIESRPPTLERALVLASYLGQELGFHGDAADYHHPDNIYLHRAIERRRGMPLTLGAIYLCIARRTGIEASLVPLPGHVMLRVRAAGKHALLDVFRGGEQKTERDVLKYLADHKLPFNPSWLRDADDAAMLQRQVNNLRASYQRRGLWREVHGLEQVLSALRRRPGDAARPPGASARA
jgi:regulator of sirC expression with transglutaminase-like and TPR domain